jgi:F-type H+-transporting ATPase subunit gamma
MKMIASTKLNRAQKAMENGRFFGQGAGGTKPNTHRLEQFTYLFIYLLPIALLEHVELAVQNPTATSPTTPTPTTRNIFVACSGDRGLCGAIHSSVSKFTKKLVEADTSAAVVVLGDKAKPQIARGAKNSIALSFNQIGKDIPTFSDAIAITQVIQNGLLSNKEANNAPAVNVQLIYNQFKSVIAYETSLMSSPTAAQLASAKGLAAYEYADDAVLEALSQFMLASRLFWALVEGHASEMSAKRMAMENASKNSDDIVENLTMQYNRTRQAVITNELVDIITGASAL